MFTKSKFHVDSESSIKKSINSHLCIAVNIIYYDLVPRDDTIASCFTFTPAPVLQYTYGELTGMLYESNEQLGTIKGGSW